MRLFIGIEIPEDIANAMTSLQVPLHGARWVEPQDYHLTLRFIGEVEKSKAYDLDEALLAIEHNAFDLSIAGISFVGGYEPKALFAGIAPSAELIALARAVDQAARTVGIAPDPRSKFRPHITLARLKSPDLDRFGRYLERSSLFRTEPFLVRRFAMFSTKPLTGGGPYLVEQSYDLRHWGEDQDAG
jgi:RNA 2',3'-cyclic 3'-phosphodiesterase